MTSRNQVFGSKVLASLLSVVVAPALALGVVATPAMASAAVEEANCQVHSIHLTKEGDGTVPRELKFIEGQLKDDQFAAYKGFRLLEKKTLRLDGDKPGKAGFSSGHRLELKLLSADAKRLKLHATLSDRGGKKPLVSTAYGIENGGVIMMGGSKYEDGRLLFAIRCAGQG